MIKEILTYEKIKIDLKKHFLSSFWDLALYVLFLPIVNIVMLSAVLLFYNPGGSFKMLFSIIFCVVYLLLVSYDLITIIIGLISTKNNQFQITSDWVIDKKHRIYGSRISLPKPYRLIFAHSGTYNIPSGINYRWSDLFAISDKKLYERTDINDEFYIVNVGKEKNIIAYNKYFFEFKEQSL